VASEEPPAPSSVSNPPQGEELGGVLAELREANERLVDAGVRLEQMAEEARDAQNRAEAANHAKDEFLAALSHELRTPLNAILGWAHLLRHGGLSDDAATRALEVIERNAKLQTRLIADLLQVSQIATGKLELELELVDLASVLTAAIDSLSPTLAAKDILLTSEMEPGIPRVRADPTRVQQVIWNLMSNAVKFTLPHGSIVVTLRQSVAMVEIVVTDSGVGIDPAFVPYMFDRFRQADGTSRRGFGGLGLGLAIVRELMELHGGTVKGESLGTGHGSRFTIAFPIPVFTTGRGQVVPPMSRRSLEDLHILVVEDDPDSRDLLAALLRGCGAEVTAVESVPQALDQFETHPPDLLITDIGLPREDGYSLIQKVRALQAGSGAGRVPAIALTAYAASRDRDRVLASGFQMHVAKPVEPDEFIEAASALVRRSKNPIS
jgi:signal transduction histidine kinase/ActR/RegA family two-component response regulator